MLEYLIDNTFVKFAGRIYQQKSACLWVLIVPCCLLICSYYPMKKAFKKQRTWTGAIRRQIQISKPKLEITKITNRQNTMRTNGQPSRQLFTKRWSLSNPNWTKSIMSKHKVKHHQNSDTKAGNREPHQNHRLGTVNNELLDGGGGGA